MKMDALLSDINIVILGSLPSITRANSCTVCKVWYRYLTGIAEEAFKEYQSPSLMILKADLHCYKLFRHKISKDLKHICDDNKLLLIAAK